MFFPQFLQACGFDLTDPFSGEIEEFADLFKSDPTSVGDIEGAGLRELPDFETGEVQLDRARTGVHIEIEVVFAGDVGAGTFAETAFAAMGGALTIDGSQEGLEFQAFGFREFLLGDGLASPQPFAGTSLIGRSSSLGILRHGRGLPRKFTDRWDNTQKGR